MDLEYLQRTEGVQRLQTRKEGDQAELLNKIKSTPLYGKLRMFAQGYSKKAHIHQGIPSPLMRLTTKPGIGRDGDNLLRRRRKILRFEITNY